jgi:uncharacterized repeat protein (TIGR03803 family)
MLNDLVDGGPAGNVILGSDGYFYGTTEAGGSPNLDDGAVYKLAPKTHAFTNVYTFSIFGPLLPAPRRFGARDGW